MRNGTLILKFFLHLAKDEQRKRLFERIDTRIARYSPAERTVDKLWPGAAEPTAGRPALGVVWSKLPWE